LSRGTLPRDLSLEVLDTIQKILFPVSDAKSRSLLRNLVSKSSFDRDCLDFESASIRENFEIDLPYRFFGARLTELYDEFEDPRPRSDFEKWLQRRSSTRHVMLATLIGVFVAVLLGIVGLGVSIYQTYIGYQAWQHPINPGAQT
jgi:hypothetical protein